MKYRIDIGTGRLRDPRLYKDGGGTYYDNAEKLYGVQADTAEFMLGIGKGRLPGAVDAYASAANQYSDPAFEGRMVGQAGADAEQAIGQQTAAMGRNLARYGINPNSGRFAGISGDNAIRGAAIKTGAMNNARNYVQDKRFGVAKDFYSSLVGMNSDAASLAGQAGGNFMQMGNNAQAKQDNEDAAWGNAIGMGAAYAFKDGGQIKMARGGLFSAADSLPPPSTGVPARQGLNPSGMIKAGKGLKDAVSGAGADKFLGTVSKGLANVADLTGSSAIGETALGAAGASTTGGSLGQAGMLVAQNAGLEGATAATVEALGAGTAAAGEAAAIASPALAGVAAAVPWVAAGAAIGSVLGLFADGGEVKKHPANGKPIVSNADGSISTERTITVEMDGRHYVVPTLHNGKQYSPKMAIEMMRAGINKPVGVFDSAGEADSFAVKRSNALGSGYADGGEAKKRGVDAYDEYFKTAGEKHGVDAALLKEMARAESGGNRHAVSSAGAKGVMQLMPDTAKMLGVKDSSDPKQSIMGAAKYMRKLLDRFDGSAPLAVAAYNAGPGRVEKTGGIPRIRETVNYVKKILPDAEVPSLPNRSGSARRAASSGVIKTASGAMSYDTRANPIPGMDQSRQAEIPEGMPVAPPMQASPMLSQQPAKPVWTPVAVDPGASASPMLPHAVAPSARPAPAKADWKRVSSPVYTIKRGDTLSRIADQHGLSIQEIMAANPNIRNANMIYAGDSLVIPGGVDIQPAQQNMVSENQPQAIPLNQWSRDLEAARANPSAQAIEPSYPVENAVTGGAYGSGVTKLVGRGIDLTRRANAAEKAARIARVDANMASQPSMSSLAFASGGKVDKKSIIDHMKESGYGSSFEDRKMVYEAIFKEKYSGTEGQNVKLLEVMNAAKQENEQEALQPVQRERIQMQGGGDVSGQGTGTSDDVPAWLSDGEFVVNAESVKMPGVKRALENINAAGLAKRYGVM